MDKKLFVLFIISSISFVIAIERNWFDAIIKKITHEIPVHQVVIFSKNMNISEPDLIFHKTIRGIPSNIINIKEAEITGYNRSLDLPVLHNPRSVTFYIIIQNEHEFHFQEVQDTLNIFAKLSTTPPRPRCLLIFFSYSNSSMNYSKDLLVHAWSLNFLDFTILEVNSYSNGGIRNYNPFTKVYSESQINSEEYPFPDKLQNMNGHVLKFPVFDRPPFTIMQNDSNHKLFGVGIHFNYFQVLSEALNYTINFIDDKNTNTWHDILR